MPTTWRPRGDPVEVEVASLHLSWWSGFRFGFGFCLGSLVAVTIVWVLFLIICPRLIDHLQRAIR